MKQKVKRTVALVCAAVMTISNCLVENVLTAKANESDQHSVVKFNNPGIGMNVGDKIDLTKFDVQFEEGKTVEAKDLTWYGSEKTYTIPFASPAIPANVGDMINLSSYKVEFEKGQASKVDTWKDGNKTINVLQVEETGVYQLTAISGSKTKNIYVVAKNASDSEYVLYYNGFGTEDGYTSEIKNGDIISYNDFVNVEDDASNPNYLTKIRTKAANTNYVIKNGRLYIERTDGVHSTIAHLLLPTWLGAFGDYRVEMSTEASAYWSRNDTWLGIDLRAQNTQNLPEGQGNDPSSTAYLIQNYIAYAGEFTANSTKKVGTDLCTGKLKYAGGDNKASKSASALVPTDPFTLVATMNGNKLSVSATQNDTTFGPAETDVARTYDTGRIGIYAHHVFQYVDHIKVSLVNLPVEETVSENTEITSFTATATGVTPLVVKDKDNHTKTIYVVVKNASDTDYVLWENNFNTAEDLPYDMGTESDYDGFGRLYGKPTVKLNEANGTLDITTTTQGHYRFPKWLGVFGNYRVQMTETTQSYESDSTQIGLFARAQDTRNYTPNYSVLLRYKGYASDAIALKVRKEWVDDSTKKSYESNIAWGKTLSMRVGDDAREYKHELLVQDNLIEYKVNDKTRLYDIRERAYQIGYVGFLLEENLKVSIDSVRVLFCPDIEAPNAPVSAVYNRTTTASGMADGNVVVKLSETGSAARDILCYWGNGTDILNGYTHFGKCVVEAGETEVTVDLGKNIMIPDGATEIRVYTENSAGRSEECVSAPLPSGVTSLKTGTELMSFQVISDTHITKNENGYASVNFKKFLEKVLMNDENSAGIWIGGDLVDKGNPEEYENFQKIWDKVEDEIGKELPEMHAIIGNHEFWGTNEDNATGKNTYKQSMTAFKKFTGNKKVYFTEEIGGYHFIYLATSELEKASSPGSHTNAVLGNAQVRWLERTLNAKAEDDKPIFIFLHQPLNETVAGSGTSGVKEHEEVKEILKKYPQAVLFTSHSHMNLDTPNTMLSSDEGLCNMFNTSAISYLMNTHYSDKSITQDGAQAYYVEVYKDMLLVRGKDVVADKWLPSSQFVVYLEGYQKPAPLAPENDVYQVDFNNYVDLEELNDDFDAYKLGEVGENAVAADVEEAFVAADKGLRRNASKVGTDTSGFSILTLKKNQYKNFEAELVYGQSWERYGIMFGGQPGEFATNLQNGLVKGTNGVAFAYTEAEGYANVRGALAAGMASSANNALKRVTKKLPTYVDSKDSATNNVNNEKLHTLKIRVVGDWMTMVVDGNEDSRVTVRIDGYDGGYISLVSNGNIKKSGVFNHLKVTALADDAELGCEKPDEKAGFKTLSEIKNDFDAYYLADAKKSSVMQKVDLVNNWFFNKQGFLSRFKSGNGTETTKVDVLTYNKKAYTDFQIDFEYQQTYNRTGIIIGGEQGVFPIGYDNDSYVSNEGVMLFMEAEGIANAMGGFTNGYTDKANLRRRLKESLPGYLDADNNASTNVTNKKVHQVTIVVKDKQVYVFVDGSDECAMYLTLPDDYAGGYVSMFSSAPRDFGFDNFVISETITKTIPQKEKVVTKNGNDVTIDFDVKIPDTTGLSAYYLGKLDKTGTLEKRDFYKNWMIANGQLNKQSNSVSTDDAEKIAVLTYTEEKYENFVATFEYQLTRGRLMFLFGTEEGKYPIYNKSGHKENGGVMLYAEADLGSGGGICALGDVKVATEGYRPMYRELPYAPGYYVKKDNGDLKAGVKYTMTVAVYNKHCSVYIDGFGLVSSFDLSDDYKAGYIGLASSNTNQHGFTFLNIQKIDDANAIKDVAAIKDITVKKGTSKSQLGLPSTVEVKDANGKNVKVSVAWEEKGYDASKEGEYLFVGNLIMPDGMTNPGLMTAKLTVRVREELPKTSSGTKFWSFDTESDLIDFESFYIANAKKDKPVAEAGPAWYVKKGKLMRDQNRTSQGNETGKLSVLTYTGSTYKNFELEVDFSQQYAREMIMFGSKTPGQYFDYENPKSADNPICIFVEYEGRRNALGNIVNTNFYNRTSTSIPNAREDYAENDSYYDKTKKVDNTGTMHHLKLRVVGDTYTVWLDDQQTVFSGKLGEGYTGGYISLVSTAQKGKFDNLKITRLNEQGEAISDDGEVVAKDNLNISFEKQAKPEEPKATVQEKKPSINVTKVVVIAAPFAILVTSIAISGLILKKDKKKVGKA